MRAGSLRQRAVVALLMATVLASACGPLVSVEPVAQVALPVPAQTSRIVASDGTVLAELHGEQDRDVVPLARVPAVLRNAVIAVEDARFYSHGGIDARAVARALLANARRRRVHQGGSTITQQLAKNAVVGGERSVTRKLSEAGVALSLERQLSKDEILERYLNTVYFGRGAYGVQAAARRYFGVDVEDVTLSQAALLAGLLKSPRDYDPFRHPDAARRRRDQVLRRMHVTGVLGPRALAHARSVGLGVVAPAHDPRWRAPWFVDHVLDVVQHDPAFAALGADPVARADVLFRGGVRVETTLDLAWQAAAEQAVSATLSSPRDPSAAVVAVDPATGGVRALIGGRLDRAAAGSGDGPPEPFSRFNLATDGRRQPGSAFKPLVLAAALARGWELDEEFDGGRRAVIPPRPGEPLPYVVRNYDDHDHGRISLRDATASSVNVVFARLLARIGPEAVVETAHAAGITTPLAPLRSLALGAQEVSPLEMASVQATLAAGGVHRPVTVVTQIVGPDGVVLYRRPPPKGRRVLDPAVTALTTEALRGVVEQGTGVRAQLGRPTAGKTGTSQRGADAWFVGYTPDLAAAVWVGFPEGAVAMVPPRTRIPVEGGNWPAEIFARMGLRALEDVPASAFPRPSGAVTTVRVDTTRNCLPNPYTPPDLVAERSYLTGTEPTRVCREPVGPPRAEVPAVVGLPVDAAQRLLEDAGFRVRRAPLRAATLPPGYVVRQRPAPGRTTDGRGGWQVTVWIAASENLTAPVPDVLGSDVVDARARLQRDGFSARVTRSCPTDGPPCDGATAAQVWRQRPAPGEHAPLHSAVRLEAYPDG